MTVAEGCQACGAVPVGRRRVLGGLAAMSLLGRIPTAAARHKRGHPPKVYGSLIGQEPHLALISDALGAIAAEFGDGTELSVDPVTGIDEQAAKVDRAQQTGFDVLLVMPFWSADLIQMLAHIADRAEEGQLLATFGRDRAEIEQAFVEVIVTEVAVLRAQADWLAANAGGGGTVIALAWPGTEDRTEAILRDHPLGGMFTLRVETIGFDQAGTLNTVEALLATAPDVVAILASWDDVALLAHGAVRASGLEVVVVGVGASPEMLAAIRDGGALATVERFVVEQARRAFTTVMTFLFNDVPPESRVIELTPLVISSGNIEAAEAWPLLDK